MEIEQKEREDFKELGMSISEEVVRIGSEAQMAKNELGQIRATLMVNFGPNGREEKLLDESLTTHEMVFNVLKHLHLQKEVIQPMKSVMIAAAEEIMRVWPAHCDAEGYGPTNLMHRLEKGIPSQYGYTAGAFAKLKAEIKALREARMIDLAIAQFTGYINTDRGHRLADLVGSMGLTAKEWKAVKKQGLSFTESEIEEIDQLLKNEG